MSIQGAIINTFFVLLFGAGVFVFLYAKRTKAHLEAESEKANRRLYELAVLKELGERIGYSLNIENIIDVITGSLHQFIEYSVVSYMLLQPEKVIFKVRIEKSVSRKFIDDVRDRMIQSISALLDRGFSKTEVEEILTGAILVEELEEPVRSFFNIPLIIGGKVQGVLTVAHTAEGLYKEADMTILYKITKQASDAVTRLEEVVKTEQRKLNAMVGSMGDGVMMTDPDYRILVANPAVRRIIGLEKKDELTIFDFIAGFGKTFDIREKLEESIKLNKNLAFDEVLLNGRFFKIFLSPVKIRSMLSPAELMLGGVVIFHDVTHEKELERLKEDFTAMMVHELRSPLDAVKNLSLILQREDIKRDEKTYAQSLRMIYESSSRMLEQVNDLLDIAKLESGKFQVTKIKGSIDALIRERAAYFDILAKNKNIELRTLFASDLPEIEFDKQATSQVIDNLIANALKFTEPGGRIMIRVFVHAMNGSISQELKEAHDAWSESVKAYQNLPESVVIVLTDTGRGISGKDMEKIFSRFQQLQTAQYMEKRGTGLGLAIVRGIIEAEGGIVGVGSTENKGSAFFFTLPISSL